MTKNFTDLLRLRRRKVHHKKSTKSRINKFVVNEVVFVSFENNLLWPAKIVSVINNLQYKIQTFGSRSELESQIRTATNASIYRWTAIKEKEYLPLLDFQAIVSFKQAMLTAIEFRNKHPIEHGDTST